MVRDFLAANYNAPAIELFREAVQEHIERRLTEPHTKERYERARQKRLGQPKKVIRLATEKKESC